MLRATASAPALALAAFALPALAQESGPLPAPFADEAPDVDQKRDVVIVTGEQAAQEQRPTTIVSRTAEEIAVTTSVINAEDSLRYFPSILVRKRHVGDTQAPITTRTSGVGASARSLIYADGVLLSALIGNNNSSASPKWGMVSPEEIASVNVLYGPFSAAYAGNSIGAVVEIETRMPDTFEAVAGVSGSLQDFQQYATSGQFGAWQASASVGNAFGPLSFWLSGTHTQSDSQPLAYVTAVRPAATGAAGAAVTGAFSSFNRTGAPIAVLGAGGLEHQEQDNLKLKAQWEISDETRLAYSLGRFANDTSASADSYLLNGAGATIWSGAVNIGGYVYTVAASAFSNQLYTFNEEQWSNSVSLDHGSKDDRIEWRLVATAYDYGTSEQRLPSVAIPGALAGGAGSIARMGGTGWKTLDAEGVFRPDGRESAHEFSLGAHGDRYELTNERFLTTDWRGGAPGALSSVARGKTQTFALWAQDAWRLSDDLMLIAGGRWETWKGYDGFNFSSPSARVTQPEIKADAFSPKASLTWAFAKGWSAKASVGKAYRFPTVGELYQLVTSGSTTLSPNPNLKPEEALSTEVSLTRNFESGEVRVSVFTEDLEQAILSQTALVDPASTTPALPPGTVITATYIQNVGKVESRGVELVAEKDDLLIRGLSLSGNLTYVESTTAANAAFPASVGKQTPQVPEWRSTLVATYRPDERWAFTVAGRWVDRTYGTLDNSDTVSHTYQGFEGFTTWDARVTLALDKHWTAAVGVENLFGADYFLFHPFPQRTATAELNYRF